MNEDMKQALMSAIRSTLVAVGAALSAKGLLDSATMQTIVGAVMVIIPALWGVWDKFRAESAAKAREVAAVNAGIAASNAEIAPTKPVAAADVPRIIQIFSSP